MVNSGRYDSEEKAIDDLILSWTDHNLEHAMRQIFFFSALFPKKHYDSFIEMAYKRHGPFSANLKEAVGGEEETAEVWSPEWVARFEAQFESCFQHIYQNTFIEDIFPEYISQITKNAFINSVEEMDFKERYLQDADKKQDNKTATATWIFDPSEYHKLTLKYFKEINEVDDGDDQI